MVPMALFMQKRGIFMQEILTVDVGMDTVEERKELLNIEHYINVLNEIKSLELAKHHTIRGISIEVADRDIHYRTFEDDELRTVTVESIILPFTLHVFVNETSVQVYPIQVSCNLARKSHSTMSKREWALWLEVIPEQYGAELLSPISKYHSMFSLDSFQLAQKLDESTTYVGFGPQYTEELLLNRPVNYENAVEQFERFYSEQISLIVQHKPNQQRLKKIHDRYATEFIPPVKEERTNLYDYYLGKYYEKVYSTDLLPLDVYKIEVDNHTYFVSAAFLCVITSSNQFRICFNVFSCALSHIHEYMEYTRGPIEIGEFFDCGYLQRKHPFHTFLVQ